MTLEAKMATLERHVFGRRAEKLPTAAAELRGAASEDESKAARDEAAKKKRQQRAARKAEEAPAREVRHAVPVEERHCPACDIEDLRPLCRGRTSEVYESILPRFERQVHVQEVLVV
ncbi:transposase [Myxococcus sp. MxC21-1]|uniref:transposase n=1 Tax=Myxococcus sp. MxC21-1 TaxID=3041439 RepID=UPI00292E638D|nr:transposase [Myxococcus sp. MxC21-1]WNZ64848.1 transposase [Myxococcus sp. MxC21-1]